MIVPIVAIAVVALLMLDRKGGKCDLSVQPGKYFTWAELTKTSFSSSNVPHTAACTGLKYFTNQVLDPLREAAGSPIYINSAFRTQKVNQEADGVHNSRHLLGLAADLRSNDYTPEGLQALVLGYRIPYRELIVYPNHLHISL